MTAPASAGGGTTTTLVAATPAQTQSKFGSGVPSADLITEVKASMTKLLESKIVDLEFNLNNRIITRIENMEKNSETHLRTAQNLENRYTIDSKRMEKLEETMAEQINIIESMNRRQKSFMEGQDELKKNLMIRIQRLENDFISKTFEALDQKFDFKHFEQTVKKL